MTRFGNKKKLNRSRGSDGYGECCCNFAILCVAIKPSFKIY